LRVAGWTEQARREGRAYALRILKELVEVRNGDDPIGARLLIDDAATFQAVGTIAQSSAMAESLLHRLAELTDSTEEQVLEDLLSELGEASSTAEPVVSGRWRRKRVDRAG
jgi:hypothetical protein